MIIGAGPTGLGAAYRLNELGYDNWHLYEKEAFPGGLAASFKKDGFTWDVGGHVLFSHYKYFDDYLEKVLEGQYTELVREAWVWLQDRFVPYPFQNNIRYLPKKVILECVEGLVEATQNYDPKKKPKNFLQLNQSILGKGIMKYFMVPYNKKVWAFPLETMSTNWVGERVSLVNISKVLENIILEKDEFGWGPNNKFKFPLNNGIGDIALRVGERIKGNLSLNEKVEKIDTTKKEITFIDGSKDSYDHLISSMPLDQFIWKSDLPKPMHTAVKNLKHSGDVIVGIGLKGSVPKKLKTKCWMYFPESNCPFYRVTVFSNYSPNNVPKGHWSLMAEISYSTSKKIEKETIIEETIKGMLNTKLIESREKIVSTWSLDVPYGYPTPSLERDGILNKVQSELLKRRVYSRGRFGAWKYEISNTDHTTMQGVEVVDLILNGVKEKTWSL